MKNASQVQDLKIEIIHWLTKVSDKKTLEKILEIKSNNELHNISPEQDAELEDRLEMYLRGELKFKNWEETKTSIRKRAKHAI